VSGNWGKVGNKPPVQNAGEGRDASQVNGRPIESGDNGAQPSEAVQAPRTGFTALISRAVTAVKQFFHRTETPKVSDPREEDFPSVDFIVTLEGDSGSDWDSTWDGESLSYTWQTAEATPASPDAAMPATPEATAQTSTPTVAPQTVGKPTLIAAAPASLEAARAEYKTAAVVVGETPLRIYAKNERTLHEIRGILSRPGLSSGTEIGTQHTPIFNALSALGFSEIPANEVASGICACGGNVEGYVEGNEVMRQKALGSEQYKAKIGPFQSYQPPDKAKIAGAKALAGMNSFIQTLTTCAAKYADADRRKQIAGRKQVMEELIKICNDPEFQVATPEWYVGGNNAYPGTRTYNSLLNGLAIVLKGMLMNSDGALSREGLQELAKDHGPEFVEQLVTTAYRTFSGGENDNTRPRLKAAYDTYCTQAENPPTDLDGLLFNEDLRAMRDIRTMTIAGIKKMNLPQNKQEEQIEQFEQQVEQNFQTWLSSHRTEETDGSVTVDVGHIKIMVNADQRDKVTLKSLNAL
jgi:hypothetical protein